jgi:hypothetical protein
MGTRRKTATWRMRRRGEYVVTPPGWKAERDGELVFTDQGQMMEFARASRLVLVDSTRYGRKHNARPAGEGRD